MKPKGAELKTNRLQNAKQQAKKRDGNRCINCGRSGTKDSPLEVHHIRPVYKGGAAGLDNLITLCRGCHRRGRHFSNIHTNEKLADYLKSLRNSRVKGEGGEGDGRI